MVQNNKALAFVEICRGVGRENHVVKRYSALLGTFPGADHQKKLSLLQNVTTFT
jgi:hypothetical protein